MKKSMLKLLIVTAVFFVWTPADAATYTYDKLDRLIEVVYGSGSDGTLSHITYTYDEAGNNTSITSLGGVLFGDIDDNRSVTLADAILTLQIISGQEPASPPVKKSDVNGDQRIGMENAIYILQKLSE